MNILIMTNVESDGIVEDCWIAGEFEKDRHNTMLVHMNYNKELDNIADVIIRRNTWFDDEARVDTYCNDTAETLKRLKNVEKPKINFDGKFDMQDKLYLARLYKKGYEVVPTIESLDEINELPETEYYILKPLGGYDGIGQIKGTFNELKEEFKKGFIMQPYMNFKSEVQFYFINRKFEYALEFIPSKVPIYPEPIEYKCTAKEIALAQKFANLNDELHGVQRIDFLKLYDNQLKLIEIEDAAPFLDLIYVNEKTRRNFLNDYKQMVYAYVNEKSTN